MKKAKIGRNELCPCGSGKKYKRCCGSLFIPMLPPDIKKAIKQKDQEIRALQKQRVQQQGLGKAIISTNSYKNRIVCVGNKVYSSTKWKTFHDFLSDYIKQLFGTNWWKNELSKSFEKRHLLLKIYDLVCHQQKTLAQTSNIKGIFTGNMPGAASLYYWLSYNLYLIAHNKNIQNGLIKRLKNPEQFAGACYETFVAAIFLKAEFSIEFENEVSREKTHCEFIATHQITGKKYEVEAKQRNRKSIISNSGSDNFKLDYKGMGNLLNDALTKDSDYERIIFIDVNLPSDKLERYSRQELQKRLVDFIKGKEHLLLLKSPAYVFLTNYPYHHDQDLEATIHYTFVLSEGFKINDFGSRETNLRQAIQSREKHKPINDLFNAIERYANIPSTFDGSIPEFTFGEDSGRLKIGDTYKIPDKNGNLVDGVLIDCTVNQQAKKAHGLCKTDAAMLLVSFELSDAEIVAYKQHPDTFFGIYKEVSNKAKTPLDLYDFFYDSFSQLSRENLLSKLQPHFDLSYLQTLSHEEMLSIYCEGLVNNGWNQGKKS